MTTSNTLAKKAPVPTSIKISEVAKLLSISRGTVRALIDTGELNGKDVNPFKKKKRLHLRVTRNSLIAFYKKQFGHSIDCALENPFES